MADSSRPRPTRRLDEKPSRGGAINDLSGIGVDRPAEPYQAKVETPAPIETRIIRLDGAVDRPALAAGQKFTVADLDRIVGTDRQNVTLPDNGGVMVLHRVVDVSQVAGRLNIEAMELWNRTFGDSRPILGDVLICDPKFLR
jgi:hypothetical protein